MVMRKKLIKESVIYGAIALFFALLSVVASRVWVFPAVIVGIMFISSFGGLMFSTEKSGKTKKQAVLKDGFKTPFALTREDIQAQIDTITRLYEEGQMPKEAYEEQKNQLESYLSKAN